MAGMSVSRASLVIAAVAAVLGAIFGAWVDWTYWNPVYGMQIVVILAAAVLLFVGLVAGRLSRRLQPFAFIIMAGVFGLGGGMALGPSREVVEGGSGTLTLRLDGPAATTTTWIASCSTVPSGQLFAVHTSESHAIGIPGGWQVLPSISLGDMWRDGVSDRSDRIGIGLVLISGDAFSTKNVPDDLLLGSDSTSRIESRSLSPASGSVHFSGLVPDPRRNPPAQPPPDVAGTIEWTCSVGSPAR